MPFIQLVENVEWVTDVHSALSCTSITARIDGRYIDTVWVEKWFSTWDVYSDGRLVKRYATMDEAKRAVLAEIGVFWVSSGDLNCITADDHGPVGSSEDQ